MTRILAVVFLPAVVLVSVQLRSQEQNQQQNSAAPAKIELAPIHQENQLGESVPLQIQLKDRNGELAVAQHSIAADVKVEQPSGQTTSYSVTFAPGESSKELPVTIPESGVAKLTVEQTNKQLIGGSNFVLVRPAGKKTGKKPKSAKEAKPEEKGPTSQLRDAPHGAPHAHLLQATMRPQSAKRPSTTRHRLRSPHRLRSCSWPYPVRTPMEEPAPMAKRVRRCRSFILGKAICSVTFKSG
jgi:hypothetical protein